MNAAPIVTRDERTISIEKDSYIWAYCFITFALLFDVMYRSFFFNEAAWDLMVFVIVGGGISTVYQYSQNTLSKGWISKASLIVLLGTGIAAFVVTLIISLAKSVSAGF